MKKGFTLIELIMLICIILIVSVPILFFIPRPKANNKIMANEKGSPVYCLRREGGLGKLEFYVINVNGCQYATTWNGEAITHLANCTNCFKNIMIEK